MTTTTIARRRPRGMYPKGRDMQQKPEGKRLPEYLDADHVHSLIRMADPVLALILLIGFRAGLRISEILALEVGDLNLEGEAPTLIVRIGKGRKARVVPLHDELRAAFRNYVAYRPAKRHELFKLNRSTVHRQIKDLVDRAESLDVIPKGRTIASHTFRHSAARHWLMNGVPINAVQLWLGHSSLSTTLIYLQILGDVHGFMARVP